MSCVPFWSPSADLVKRQHPLQGRLRFGLGAEIGISTDKYHARDPCGLRELASYKYVIMGQGQVRI